MSRLVAIPPELQAQAIARVEEHLASGGELIEVPRYALHAIAGSCPQRYVRTLEHWLDPVTAAVATEDRVDAAQVISRLNGVRTRLATRLAAQAALGERRALEHATRKARAKLEGGTRERFTGFPDSRAVNAAGGVTTLLDGAWTSVKDSMTEAVNDAAEDKVTILAPVVGSAEAETQSDLYRRRGLEAVAFMMALLAARAEGAISGGGRKIPLLGPGVRRAAQFIEGASGSLDQEPHRGAPRVPPDVVSVIAAAPDQRLIWTWFHDFYGVPNQPFDPHVEIDGNGYTTAELEDLEWYPGDHVGCLCEAVPELAVF